MFNTRHNLRRPVRLALVMALTVAACGTDNSADSAAVEDTVRQVAAALSAGNVAGYAALFTDKGLEADQGMSRDEFLVSDPGFFQTPVELRGFENTRIDGDTATTDGTYVIFGISLGKSRFRLVKDAGSWKLDDSPDASPLPLDIPGDVQVIDVGLTEFAFQFDPSEITGGNIAFSLDNTGKQEHEAVLVRVAAGVDLMSALMSESEGPPEGIEPIGFASAEAGEKTTMVFTEPLEAGTYALLCFFPDVDDPDHTPHAFKGMVAEFSVTA